MVHPWAVLMAYMSVVMKDISMVDHLAAYLVVRKGLSWVAQKGRLWDSSKVLSWADHWGGYWVDYLAVPLGYILPHSIVVLLFEQALRISLVGRHQHCIQIE